MNRYVLLFLHVISLVLLGFGWFMYVLDINISTHFMVDITLFHEKRSVVTMLQKLWSDSNYWPFLLIFLFGIIIPALKSFALFYIILAKTPNIKWQIWVRAISKWAMADVFTISIFVAFLGANAMDNTKATLLPGFYYFSAYVILSSVVAVFSARMLKNSA